MVFEKVLLSLERLVDGLSVINISLASIHNGDVAQPKRNDTVRQNIDDIGSLIHQINLG